MSDFDLAAAAQLAGGVVRPGVFLLIDAWPGPLRVFTGFGDRELEPDAVDAEGGIYTGVGQLIGLPAVSQLINGVAQRIEYTLPIGDETLLALADSEADTIRGARCFQGFTAFDEHWRPMFRPLWLTELVIDVLRPNFAADASTLTVSAATVTSARRRASFNRWTGPAHRAAHPTDAFCDRTSLYAPLTTVKWPSK